jgi:hypothetical protein
VHQHVDDPDDAPVPIIKSSRPDLVLERIPPFPAVTHATFQTILQAKLAILKTDCDYNDPNADLQAKAVQAFTFSELLDFAQSPAIKQCPNISGLIEFAATPLFRHPAAVSPVFLRSDDLVDQLEARWPLYSRHYDLLNRLILVFPMNPQFDQNFTDRALSAIGFADGRERRSAASVVLSLLTTHTPFIPAIVEHCKVNLMDFADSEGSVLVVQPTLIVLFSIFQSAPSSCIQIYDEQILPLFRSLHFSGFHAQIRDIVELFFDHTPRATVKATVDALLKYFPATRPSKTGDFLSLLASGLIKLDEGDAQQSLRATAALLARCATSGHVKSVEAMLPFWRSRSLEPLLMENAPAMFPILYPALSRALTTTWSPAIRTALGEILRTMSRLNPMLFTDLSRHEGQRLDVNREQARVWAGIVRAAWHAGFPGNMSEKLFEVQRKFASVSARKSAAEMPPLRPAPAAAVVEAVRPAPIVKVRARLCASPGPRPLVQGLPRR